MAQHQGRGQGIAEIIRRRIQSAEVEPGKILVLAPRRQFGYAIRDALNSLGVFAHSFFHEEALDGADAQQAFTLLTLLAEPEDRVALRCWCGFGSTSLRNGAWGCLRAHCESSGETPWAVLERLASGGLTIPYTGALVAQFEELQRRLGELAPVRGQALVDALFPGESDWTNFMRSLASTFEGNEFDAQELRESLRIGITQPELPTEVDYVRVMSLHKSKGLTADLVAVVGCVEGLVPTLKGTLAEQAASLEEQRRLFYVAVTRTRRALVLSSVTQLPRTLAYQMGAQVQKQNWSLRHHYRVEVSHRAWSFETRCRIGDHPSRRRANVSGQRNNAGDCPRLIEVALPVREISAESVRDKNIHHAHISHLHIWWARRPLPASRAVVFASLVPDPDDPQCPQDFQATVERCLQTHVPGILKHYRRGRNSHRDEAPYRPYEGIQDTLRNRLLMFIAKWSPESLEFDAGNRKNPAPPKLLLDDRSLVKWETSDPENAQGLEVLRIARELVRVAHNGDMPTVLDPFAGGGAIPLEAGRLGCQAIANDYNPVAHLILRATCEFPQKYGKPGTRKAYLEEFDRKVERVIQVSNVLVHDFERWSNSVLERARQKIEHLYPAGKDGRPVLAYLWARTTPCSNPSCQGQIPLLRSLVMRNKAPKVALTLDVDQERKRVSFGIAQGEAIKRTKGTKRPRGPAICPFCEQPTSEAEIRMAGRAGQMDEQIVCVVVEGLGGKDYRPVEDIDFVGFARAEAIGVECPRESIPENQWNVKTWLYGMNTWGALFNRRQLVAMQAFVASLHEALEAMDQAIPDKNYRLALVLYLGLWLDRVAVFNNNVTRWRSSHQKSETPFGGQAIPIIWDYPEVNPLAKSSGTASTQLRYMLKVIEHECIANGSSITEPIVLLGNAASLPLGSGIAHCVVTDPPYDDAIAYGDLSDFFYVWLKRSIGSLYPEVFTTPLTPKVDEATSLRHRHDGSQELARTHYRRLLKESFSEALRLVREPKFVTVMFAHQSTDAWTALISALFEAGLSPNATWPIATEMQKTALALGTASLETSVTVACRPRIVGSAVSFRQVRGEIEDVVRYSLKRFWSYGFRGADLIVACYGPAVGVFGKYERVEKADGTPVGIPELLDLAKQVARDAIAGEFRGDNLSTLYYVWANLYGAAEQAWDDARLVVQIGGDQDNAMEVARGHGIFVVDGSKCRLAVLEDRADRRGLGIDQNPPHIDALHRSMLLWKEEKRKDLVEYLAERGLLEDGPFWKLVQALFEVLPRDLEDWKLVSALLGERRTLRTEGKSTAYSDPQQQLFFNKGGSRRL